MSDSSFDLLTQVAAAASAAPVPKARPPPKPIPVRATSVPPKTVPVADETPKIPVAMEPKVVTATIKNDWHLFLTVEERNNIRTNIRSAYKRKTATYEELLETCAAIEEELVFLSAPSRLDYFKAGIQYEKRVAEKRRQLTGDHSSLTMPSVVETPSQPSLKRSRSAPSGNPNDC